MCSQVSCVKVTYVPACAAFKPAIRAVIFNPLPFSSPISTPHTSLLLFERACCRIWRNTSPSIVTRGCCAGSRFLMSSSIRQLGSQHCGPVSPNQIRSFHLVRTHAEHVIQRQTQLIQRPPPKTLASRVVVNRLHHSHLSVLRATSLLIMNASYRNKALFAGAASRTLQLVHNVPAELHHRVIRA